MTQRRWSPLAWLALIASACGGSGATINYKGKELPPLVSASEVELFAGREAPYGHSFLGVVTTECGTLNGSPGLLGSPCHEEAMIQAARDHAARTGGTGLLDLNCNLGASERFISNVDGGRVTQSDKKTFRCQASVLRRDAGAPPPTATSGPPPRAITVNGTQVEVRFDAAKSPPAATAPTSKKPNADAVGVMTEPTPNSTLIGRIVAECPEGCAVATVRRALRAVAAEKGAMAIAKVRCLLFGSRWRCTADAIQAAVVQRPAPEPSAPAPPPSIDAPTSPAPASTAASPSATPPLPTP